MGRLTQTTEETISNEYSESEETTVSVTFIITHEFEFRLRVFINSLKSI
jgi:hypothetical protein